MKDLKHLSIVDGAFLHLETPEMPMHVGSLHLFELPEGYQGNWYEDVKAHVTSRMHLAPVFTRKLALMPFDLANPVWITDEDIDLDYHMRYLVLPKPGTLEQLHTLVGRLHSMLLDRSRPLWEFYVIEGLASGQMAFYGKVHHAAIDGQAGVMLGQSIFDLTPEPRKVRPPRPRRGSRYQLGFAEMLAAGLENQLNQVLQLGKLVPGLARSLASTVGETLRGLRAPTPPGTQAGSKLKLAPPTPFNHSITNQRAFSGVTLPLDDTKRIGKALGASINDMVLWLCATALRGYLNDSRELPDKTLVAMVPISLREQGDATMNNQVAGTVIDLGTQQADPLQRLEVIRAGTAAMKKQMGTWGGVVPTDFPSLGSPWLISGLASLYGRSRLADRLRFANVTISNVPGTPVPVYLAGAKMLDHLPVSIVVHGVALNITVQSYMGQLCFGLIACRRAVPDIDELGKQLQRAFETMLKLPLPEAKAAAIPPASVEKLPAAAVAPAKKRRPALPKPARQAAAVVPIKAPAAAKRARVSAGGG
ncbi:wax ester/triacylglycerol synthase family O-acyltransferase [Aquincola sp. S2]|uniref:diacylglycerol O-acyltransferase n=1 Tax=Pseudaquabacterium terrae TaxID=2732868 RepID=A0ABX2EJV8_9BURK|nr:wax ester/triacylglycerol synthase family O-acyltransferase [Aquabacterium terrae]NRF68857.1 wax ester/triacylglycerol synthase family O-acyltransferase [Aquabacterium terrae]